jgi:L-aspartate oxidase
MAWGAAFDRASDGSLALAREGAHSVRRVLHARDATGREIARVLAAQLAGRATVEIADHATAVDIVVESGRACGVRALAPDGTLLEARARAVLLATGGAGQVFAETTNPEVATGDGIALACRAGADVVDLEFVQFHPTVLAVPGAPRYLLTEALRGEGARIVNAHGERFLGAGGGPGELAARDQISRAIVREAERTAAPVYLTMAHLDAGDVRARFPYVAELCRRAGLDLATDRIPIAPAAHYLMGGIATDLDGRTSVPGLFAAGETASTGVHGANRLASNSLLEGLVFGARAAEAMMASGEEAAEPVVSRPRDQRTDWGPPDPRTRERLELPIDADSIRRLMWSRAGVFRSGAGLRAALDVLEPARQALDRGLAEGRRLEAGDWRVVNLLTVAALIARAALRREESRGAHARADFPARDDLHWKRRVTDRCEAVHPTEER